MKFDPQYLSNKVRIENQVKKYKSNQQYRSNKIRIPVVVHVLYNTDQENISDSIIFSQIEALNRDFGQLLNTTYPAATASKIEFALATADPSGIKTNGITRKQTITKNFQTGASIMYHSQGGKDAWPVDKYLNIWVGNISGVLGYAYMPGTMHDGVVINFKYFGLTNKPPFHLGRTVTHEVGHWLNLYHTWGLSTGCEADDEVDDTPNSAEPNFGCKLDHQSCGGTDMVENFMDYSDDACMNLFTRGQIDRMESLFTPGGYRYSIITSQGLDQGMVDPCYNNLKDNGETGIDCGGLCVPCPTCNDNIKNGTETDIDCGGDCRPCDCVSKGEFSGLDFIQSIKINDSISTTSDEGGYYFGQNTYFSLYNNAPNRIEFTPAKTENAGQHYWNIWIDWNHDGIYSGYGERVYASLNIGRLSDSFSLAEIAKKYTGDTFSIRIQMKWGEEIKSGCDTFDFGEVEDYRIILSKKYLDPCTNGMQDENEKGIDCGPFCTPCTIVYCTSAGKTSKYEYIKKITWNDIPYVTGNNNGYRDFTESIINISNTREIKYKLEAGFAGNYILTENWMIYADWNSDGDFDDTDETIIKTSSNIPLIGSITIPQNTVGKIRVRVIMTDAGNTKSCGSYVFGETEDYMVDIETPSLRKLNESIKDGVNIFPNPADQYFIIQSNDGSKLNQVMVRNFLGQLIFSEKTNQESFTFNSSMMVSGNYILTIKNSKNKSYQYKMTITH